MCSIFRNSVGTTIYFNEEQRLWNLKLADNIPSTTGTSKSTVVSFLLGKHRWTIDNDTYVCGQGNPYTIDLKLTGCKEDEFTCSDGQCIKMTRRCDQLPNCRDKSDETGCKLMKLEEGYNKMIPPITSINESTVQVPVHVSVNLQNIVEVEEVRNKIWIQFEICLEWNETRATYQNLKTKTAMNVLKEEDKTDLWLPLVIYDNTDQKETTRLGKRSEWRTEVNVKRVGNFSRGGLEQVDEVELFGGDENPLIMKQVYTHRFQCEYHLEFYPFDTQTCSIEMVLSSYDMEMVQLTPHQLIMSNNKDLALFRITEWRLQFRNSDRADDGVRMKIVLKRKVMTVLLTTYLPSTLLLLITFATTFFKPFFFEAALSVNLTTMLVMTTIFIGEMQKLPITAYIKFVDIWLVFCQLVPFAEVILLTAMEFFRKEADGKVIKDSNHKGLIHVHSNAENNDEKEEATEESTLPLLKMLGTLYECFSEITSKNMFCSEKRVLPVAVSLFISAYATTAFVIYFVAI